MNYKFSAPAIVAIAALGLSACNQSTLSEVGSESISQSSWTVAGDTYSTKIEYDTPVGLEWNTVTLTMEDGVVLDAVVEVDSDNETSREYQEGFADELPSLIVGKTLGDIRDLDIVAGASVTTEAFNVALNNLDS